MSLRRSSRVSIRTTSLAPDESTSLTKRKVSATVASTSSKRSRPITSEASEHSPLRNPRPPTTPVRKKRAAIDPLTTLTPTPSLVTALRAPYSTGDIDDATPPPQDRPVQPHISNATLVTPGGTRTVAYNNTSASNANISRDGLPPPTSTTGTLLEQACAHLISVDPRMKPLIEQHRCAIFAPEGLAEQIDPFRSLASGIMGQQVSGAAAKAIKNKFVALFTEEDAQVAVFPTVGQVAATSIERLRLAGLSQRKAEYIQGLAQKFVDGELTTDMLMRASDDEVMEKLTAVRGLGKWSVEMFICFGLKRMDILSTGDLGVQRGMAHFYGRDVQKLKAKGGGKWKYMSEQDMLDKSAPFAPYRSLFMWYMWRVEDVDIDVLQ